MEIICNNCHALKIGVSFEFHLATEELHIRASNWPILAAIMRRIRTQILNAEVK